MNATLDPPKARFRGIPPLENGDHLSATEFLRRYEAMPEVKKAELIDGIVYMASPVSLLHAEPDSLMQGWLFHYAISTPGTKSATNATAKLSPDDVPQPDALLRLLPECGGRSRLDDKGYLLGPPELAVEIAASSASIDLREKRLTYRRAGVREYLVWRTREEEIDWWTLEADEYVALAAGENGVIRSRVFPGLWLNPAALLAEDGPGLIATLNQGLASEEHRAFVAALSKDLPAPSSP